MSTSSSSSKNSNKRPRESSRYCDKNKLASESGSSQCDTPPLVDKDGSSPSGKFAGVGPDSIYCYAEQIGVELNLEAATNLAEDTSYRLRQMISTISLQSGMFMKTRGDCFDVKTVYDLADISPSICSIGTEFVVVGDEKILTDLDPIINVAELAMKTEKCEYISHPKLSTEWITGEKSLNHSSPYSSNISAPLQNYYTTVARAILNLNKKLKETAVRDLMTNTKIGPIFPNLFNLAVLVLNDDNLNALNVPAKRPLQSNVLDMVDALCSNPCSADTNIQQQFQRLFPVMVSNILGNGSMSEKMFNILTKITRTWPSFIKIGKSILFEYLSHSTKDRLTGPMIKCVMALGRQALYECLDSNDNLEHLDNCLVQTKWSKAQADLRSTMLEVATVLLRSEPTTKLEDFIGCDYAMYEVIGDAVVPRRTIFPMSKPKPAEGEESSSDEESFPQRSYLRRLTIKLLPPTQRVRNGLNTETIFEPTRFTTNKSIKLNIRNCRTKIIHSKYQAPVAQSCITTHIVIAGGLLQRFKYKIPKPNLAPIYAAIAL